MNATKSMVRVFWYAILSIAVCLVASEAAEPEAAPQPATTPPMAAVSFVNQIAPILVARCQACHGPNKAENSYRLDTFEHLQLPGENELAPITPGDPQESELVRLVRSDDPDERMPKEGDPLTADQIAAVERWINEGAKFDGPDPKLALASMLPRQPYPQPPERYPAPVPITALAFHPQGTELFVGGYHEVTVWSPMDGRLLRRIERVAERTFALAFNHDGTMFAIGGGVPGRSGEVRLLKSDDGAEVKLLGSTQDVVFDLAFSPDGKRLAAVSADRSLRVFDVLSGAQERAIENHADWVMAVAWSPDGELMATASRDKTAKVFHASSGELRLTYSGHAEPVFGVRFHPDGKQVYSAGGDRKIHLWTVDEGKKVAELGGYSGDVHKLQMADGQLYSSSADKTVRQHGANDQKEVRRYDQHPDWVLALAVHAASQRLASGCFDGTVRVWNAADGSLVTSFVAAPGYAPRTD